MEDRDFDVILFGATSVTGRRTASYLVDRVAQTGQSWAAAGRDPAKVASVLAEEGVIAPQTIVADVSDPASLAAMAGRGKVLLNLVGPYTRYGQPVIEACVTAGTHYVDLTGEIPFVRRMIDAYDDAAREAGVKIVQVCGFEALPPDLGVLLAAETAAERWGEPLAGVDVELTSKAPPGMPRPSDMLSAGTMHSLVEVSASPDAKVGLDPGALVDDPTRAEMIRALSPIKLAPRRNERGAVIAPMMPAAFINPAVIQRTAALIDAQTGQAREPIRYREGFAIGGPALTLAPRYLAAGAMSGVQAGVAALARARPGIKKPLTDLMRKGLPASGYGPAADRLDWRWRIQIAAHTTNGHDVGVTIDAEGHPGYLATSRMMGEAGLLLADDGATPGRAGCLTPATAIGTQGIERFSAAKVDFSIDA